ncbi:MAG: type II toxin-antitoxin system RelE/ParE family toxin [Acidobacteria bacterium]|nr:type II toxin-antitoxin system RelE/ParE family toxin [Acidobacteriota bacterium]
MKVTYADGVFEELVGLSCYLAENDEEIAQKFLDACDRTFLFLAANRFAGALRHFQSPGLAEVRMWRVQGFEKFLIFYKPSDEGVRILHILHSALDYKRVFEED